MTKRPYEDVASRILESGTRIEAELKRAELYAYMDRTEAMKPEPVIKNVTEVYVIEERTGGGDWKLLEVFTNERKASERFTNLGIATQSSDGYWEVRARNFPVSKS